MLRFGIIPDDAVESLLPRGFRADPRDQWAASFVVVSDGASTTTATTARRHNALTLRVRFASPFAAISQGKYLEADYTLHSLLHLGGGGGSAVVAADTGDAPAEASSSPSSSSSKPTNKNKDKKKRQRMEEEE